MTRALLLCALSGCAIIDTSVFKTKAERRNLDCQRLSDVEAAARFPGQVPPTPSKELAGGLGDLLACSTRYLQTGDRPNRDEAILSTLSTQVTELAESAAATAPQTTRWHVDAFYPSMPVAQKIAVAARTTLAQRGFVVSDRVPTLAAGDVAFLTTLPQSEVYRIACARSFATEVLGAEEALLGLMLLDAKETQLHGGVCLRGEWRWLQ